MRQFKVQIPTQTDNQNQKNKTLQTRKLHSDKTKFKISKLQLENFMQNNILEQAMVTQQGAHYMERAAKVKGQTVWWDSLEK